MIFHQKSQIMRITCGIGLATVLFCGIVETVLAVKPKPPLDLQIDTADQQDGTIEIKLTATANMEIKSAELSLQLPKSLSLIEGEKKWAGQIRSGEKKIVTLRVQKISTAPGEIVAEGTVYFPEGETFVQKSRIPINHDEEMPPSRSLPPPIKQKQGNGAILEFKEGGE